MLYIKLFIEREKNTGQSAPECPFKSDTAVCRCRPRSRRCTPRATYASLKKNPSSFVEVYERSDVIQKPCPRLRDKRALVTQ